MGGICKMSFLLGITVGVLAAMCGVSVGAAVLILGMHVRT